MPKVLDLERYFVYERIGGGAFGDVHLAKHKLLDREVAIKFINSDISENERRRFLNESRLVSRLSHPHILHVYDFDELPDGRSYMAVEYLPNGDLGAWVEKLMADKQRVSVINALYIVKSVAVGLHYAHQHGMVHRDVKPSNVFFARDGRVVIGDFGLAKELEATRSQSLELSGVAGTPAYISPEQIQGQEATLQSDIYALGVLLYWLLAGVTPYTGRLGDLLKQHLYAPIPSLCAQRPELSPLADDVIRKAMAKSSDQRYANMEAFIDDLDALIATVPNTDETLSIKVPVSLASVSMLRMPTILETQSVPAWRERLVPYGGILAAMLVLLLGGIFVGSQLSGTDEPAPAANSVVPAANIPPAGENEYLLLVSPMVESDSNIDIAERVIDQLQNGELGLGFGSRVRIERLDASINSSSMAQQAGEATQANVIIWGQRNAAGWEIRVEGVNRSDGTLQDLRLFVFDDEQLDNHLVSNVPIMTDYYARLLLVHDIILTDNYGDTAALLFTFREFDTEGALELAQRPTDRDVLQIINLALAGSFQEGDQQASELLNLLPNDLTLLSLRWVSNLVAGRVDVAVRDLDRMASVLGEDSELVPAMLATTYYLAGDGEMLLAVAEPFFDSATPSAEASQSLAGEILIHNGEFAWTQSYIEPRVGSFDRQRTILYDLQNDSENYEIARTDYLDDRSNRLGSEGVGVFSEFNPSGIHPAAYLFAAYADYLSGDYNSAELALLFALAFSPDDYLMNWLLGNILADEGDYQAAFDRLDVAVRNAPVPFPIGFYQQSEILLTAPDAVATPVDACKLLSEAQRQAETDADFYAILLDDIAALQATHCEVQ